MVNAAFSGIFEIDKRSAFQKRKKKETRISGNPSLESVEASSVLFLPIKVGVEQLVKNVLTMPLDRAACPSPVFTDARKTGEFIKRLCISTRRLDKLQPSFPEVY